MSQNDKIVNDSVALNNLMIDRVDIDRNDLLDTKCHAELSFTLEDGMISNYKILKKRRVKR